MKQILLYSILSLTVIGCSPITEQLELNRLRAKRDTYDFLFTEWAACYAHYGKSEYMKKALLYNDSALIYSDSVRAIHRKTEKQAPAKTNFICDEPR